MTGRPAPTGAQLRKIPGRRDSLGRCAQEARDIFEAGGRKLILANSSYESGSEDQNEQLAQMTKIVKSYDPAGVITGEGAMTKDLIEVADVDFRNVSITSILVVFLIVAVVFRSASVPVLLVAAIESAITINMGIPYFSGAGAALRSQHCYRYHPAWRYGRLRHPDDHPIP